MYGLSIRPSVAEERLVRLTVVNANEDETSWEHNSSVNGVSPQQLTVHAEVANPNSLNSSENWYIAMATAGNARYIRRMKRNGGPIAATPVQCWQLLPEQKSISVEIPSDEAAFFRVVTEGEGCP
jgi:hypothetical protein